MSRGPSFKALVNILPSALGPIQGRMPDPSRLFTSAGKAGIMFHRMGPFKFWKGKGGLWAQGGPEAGLSPGLIITLRSLLLCLEWVLRQSEISLPLSVKGCGSEQSVPHGSCKATLSAVATLCRVRKRIGTQRPHRPATQGGPRHWVYCPLHKNDFPGRDEGQLSSPACPQSSLPLLGPSI